MVCPFRKERNDAFRLQMLLLLRCSCPHSATRGQNYAASFEGELSTLVDSGEEQRAGARQSGPHPLQMKERVFSKRGARLDRRVSLLRGQQAGRQADTRALKRIAFPLMS